jgi:putative glycosyltransferase
MKLSIVTTLYHSEKTINEFHLLVSKEAKKIFNDNYEVIYVNDCSPDNSLEKSIAIFKKDKHTKIIDLSRNFGHHKAMMTGLNHARGEFIFLLDVDLEEDPRYLGSFFDQMKKENCDVVYGKQKKRRGNWFENISGTLFWNFFQLISGLSSDVNPSTIRIMTRRYVDALILHKESDIFIYGIWALTGFVQKPHLIDKGNDSPTTYTLAKRIPLLLTSITSFSEQPLIAIFYIGLIILLISIITILIILYGYFMHNITIEGWTSQLVSIWFFGGLIITFMGIIAIYLSKVFIETKNRPLTIIKKIYTSSKN